MHLDIESNFTSILRDNIPPQFFDFIAEFSGLRIVIKYFDFRDIDSVISWF